MRKNATLGICFVVAGFMMACGRDQGGVHVGVTRQALAVETEASEDWVMAGYDAAASHHNRAETELNASNVRHLTVAWQFDAEDVEHDVGPIHASPVVADDAIFVGSMFGRFYAIDEDGTLIWEYETRQPNPLAGALFIPVPIGDRVEGAVATPVVGAAVLAEDLVIFGDVDGNIYGLERDTGAEVWVRERLNPHPLGGIVGNSLLLVGDMLVIGMSSAENLGLVLPALGLPYECCSHTGFVVALDVATGAEIWRYETIPASAVQRLPAAFAPFARGPAGADIWGQPTYDAVTHTVYVGTGQNLAPRATAGPPFSTGRSDSLIALDASTGDEKWAVQFTEGDIWLTGVVNPNTREPNTGVPRFPFSRVGFLDLDFGDSPKPYTLADGRRVIGAGQKSGVYHVVDAGTGARLFSTQHLTMANSLGGFQTGGALAGNTVFQHGLDGLDRTGQGPFNGVVSALSLDGTREKWRFIVPLSPLAGGLAVANDVVYFVSMREEPVASPPPPQQWALYALSTTTGELLARVPMEGRALSGPVVSDGRVYTGMGNSAVSDFGRDETGGLVAFGLTDND